MAERISKILMVGLLVACASPALARQTDPNAPAPVAGAPASGQQKKSSLDKAAAVAGGLVAIMAAYKAVKAGAPLAAAAAPAAAPSAAAVSSPALGTSLLSK